MTGLNKMHLGMANSKFKIYLGGTLKNSRKDKIPAEFFDFKKVEGQELV